MAINPYKVRIAIKKIPVSADSPLTAMQTAFSHLPGSYHSQVSAISVRKAKTPKLKKGEKKPPANSSGGRKEFSVNIAVKNIVVEAFNSMGAVEGAIRNLPNNMSQRVGSVSVGYLEKTSSILAKTGIAEDKSPAVWDRIEEDSEYWEAQDVLDAQMKASHVTSDAESYPASPAMLWTKKIEEMFKPKSAEHWENVIRLIEADPDTSEFQKELDIMNVRLASGDLPIIPVVKAKAFAKAMQILWLQYKPQIAYKIIARLPKFTQKILDMLFKPKL